MKEPFLTAIPLLATIEAAGFEAYFVGGAVRDLLLGKKIADIDIATSATPEEIKAIFPKTIDVGIEHGTIVVLYSGIPYEVTTFRAEAEYIDCRRPSEVEFIRSLKEDLQRRDFTMNAIAMDKEGRFIDPFDGKKAIQEKIIRTVGKAEERFSEDALRMMRAVRFFSQLDFEVEVKTQAALESIGYLLEKISVERKFVEFEKLLAGKNRIKALKLLTDTGLFQYLPGMASFQSSLICITQFECRQLSVEEMWSHLIYQFGLNEDEAARFLRNWKMPSKEIKKILSILKWLNVRKQMDWANESLYDAGIDTAVSTEKLYHVLSNNKGNANTDILIEKYKSLPIRQRSELQVTGNDLQAWFQRKPGPWIKEKLKNAEHAVINMEISNRKESIREWLLGCSQS